MLHKFECFCVRYVIPSIALLVLGIFIGASIHSRSSTSGPTVIVGKAVPLNMDNENNRAMELYFKGEYVQAEEILRHELARLRQAEKVDRSYLGTILPHYGAVLDKLGRFEEAEAAYNEGIALLKDTLATDEFLICVKYQEYMAHFYMTNGKTEQAEAMFKTVLAALEENMKMDRHAFRQFLISKTAEDYVALLKQQGRPDDAIAVLQQALVLSDKSSKRLSEEL